MKIFRNIISRINNNRLMVLISCLAVCLILQLIMLFRAINGSALKDWGYSEFLLNYSAGFIRRGLPGSVLNGIYKYLGLNPYLFLTFFLSLIIFIITILFFYLLNSSRLNGIQIFFIALNPILINSPFLSVIMFRKDWLIILGLIIHALFNRLISIGRLHSKQYLLFFTLYVLYSQIIILSHEIGILFIFAHIFLIKSAIHNLEQNHKRTIKKLILLYIGTQFISFVFLAVNHGTQNQIDKIVAGLPSEFKLGNVSALNSIANDPSQQFTNIALGMFTNTFSLIFFIIWFLIGPVFLHLLFNHTTSINNRWYFGAIFPLLILFVLGNDWGRWIVLISFVVVILRLADSEIVNLKINLTPKNLRTLITNIKLRIAILVLVFALPLLLIRIPIYTPKYPSDALSGIFEVLFLKTTK